MKIHLGAALAAGLLLSGCIEYIEGRPVGTFLYEGKEYVVIETVRRRGRPDAFTDTNGFQIGIPNSARPGEVIGIGFCDQPLGSPECNRIFGAAIDQWENRGSIDNDDSGGGMY